MSAFIPTSTFHSNTMLSNSQSENEENNSWNSAARCGPRKCFPPPWSGYCGELHFTGRLSVVVQNGRVLKSGYEEGYFRQHEPTVS